MPVAPRYRLLIIIALAADRPSSNILPRKRAGQPPADAGSAGDGRRIRTRNDARPATRSGFAGVGQQLRNEIGKQLVSRATQVAVRQVQIFFLELPHKRRVDVDDTWIDLL